MTPTKTHLWSLALAASLVLGVGEAAAQRSPQSARAANRDEASPDRANPLFRPVLMWKTGVVQSFVYERGRVRGVVLSDGTAVLMRRGGRSAFRGVRPGAVVRIRGFVIPMDVRRTVRQASIVVLGQPDRVVSDTRPSASVPEPVATPAPIVIRGSIRGLVQSANGWSRMLVLSNGATVTLPISMARKLALRGVSVGERVTVYLGRANPEPGAPLVAETLVFADGSAVNAR